MSSRGSEASASLTLLLCPPAQRAHHSVQDWHDAVAGGRAVGWIRLRGSTREARSAISDLAVPHLRSQDLGDVLAMTTERAPVVHVIGELNVVTAQVPEVSRTGPAGLRLDLRALRIIASTGCVVTFVVDDVAGGANAVDRVLDSVDLEAASGWYPSGNDLVVLW